MWSSEPRGMILISIFQQFFAGGGVVLFFGGGGGDWALGCNSVMF